MKAVAAPDRATRIVICGGGHADGPNAAAVLSILERRVPGATVEATEDLCGNLARLSELGRARAEERVVLGLCRRGASDDELQIWARRAGLDPFGVEAVDLELSSRLGPTNGADERAAAALAGAGAALRVSPATPATQLAVRLAQEGLSRRALLSLPVSYRGVAAVDQTACVGTERCGLCVPACPPSAIRASEPFPSVDASTCVACGACLGACPADAVGLPRANLRQQEARIGTLLEWGWQDGTPGLILACRGAVVALSEAAPLKELFPRWLPVTVPCLSSVTPAWILQALVGGSPAVALLGCGDRCGTDSTARLSPRLDYCIEVLRSLDEGEPASRVRFATSEDIGSLFEPNGPPLSIAGRNGVVLVEPDGTADAVRRFAAGRAIRPIEHDASPVGAVSVEVDGCTLCGVCAERCPTGALLLRTDEDTALLLDGARCLACGHCQEACPEHVVRVERRTEIAALSGPTTVKQEPTVRCARCGRAVGPPSMIRRVVELLPDATPELRDRLVNLCSDCRGL